LAFGTVDSLQLASGNSLNVSIGLSVFGTQIINDGNLQVTGIPDDRTGLIIDGNVTSKGGAQ
jgi:hypothetical protein